MNERIIKLAYEAGMRSPDLFKLTVSHMSIDTLEKFAELIVRESIEILEHRYKWDGDADGTEVKKCIAKIKQHFGVE